MEGNTDLVGFDDEKVSLYITGSEESVSKTKRQCQSKEGDKETENIDSLPSVFVEKLTPSLESVAVDRVRRVDREESEVAVGETDEGVKVRMWLKAARKEERRFERT